MYKKIIVVAAGALVALTLAGCGSQAEEPNVPAQGTTASNSDYTLTETEKLKSLAVGETAAWRDYEVTVASVERANGTLTVHLDVKAHSNSKDISTECLMSFGMPPTGSSFENNTISVPAGETVSGTLTFDDQYNSQRLFWNDGATEATWLLDQTPAATAPAPTPETPAEPEPAEDPQAKAVAAIEGALPGLVADNTYYTYQSFDPATAAVTPIEGGYQYVNDIAILDGNGNPTTTNIVLSCDDDGNVTSMTIDGALVF